MAVAQTLGLSFVLLDARDSSEAISQVLFGATSESEQALLDGRAPGELGRDEPTLLYIAAVQQLPVELFPRFAQLLDRRTFHDATGTRWSASEDVVMMAGITIPSETITLSPENWLGAKFHRVDIRPPSSTDDLFAIAESITTELKPRVQLLPDAAAVLSRVRTASENLHVLKRWLAYAHGTTTDHIGRDDLEKAMLNDLQWYCERCEYRGQNLDPEIARQWLSQFPNELFAVGMSLLRQISERFFITKRRYFGALQELIVKSGLTSQEVVFCNWQSLGRSGPRVAHEIKNQAGWKVRHHLDLDSKNWNSLQIDYPHQFVIADDFVGTGKTLAKLFRSDKPGAGVRLLERFPKAHLSLLILVGFDDGMREVLTAIGTLRKRVSVHRAIQFSRADRCFTEESAILLPDQKGPLEQFCRAAARANFRKLPKRFHLGFDAFSSLIVFPDTVPNNTLPIIWYTDRWIPLFPATGGVALPNNLLQRTLDRGDPKRASIGWKRWTIIVLLILLIIGLCISLLRLL
jgi:hypothetical protein